MVTAFATITLLAPLIGLIPPQRHVGQVNFQGRHLQSIRQ